MTQKEMTSQGEKLVAITSFPGWEVVVQLLQDQIDTASYKLLNCRVGEGDPTTLHTRYRAQLEMLDGLQYSINARIAAFNTTN
jgi:hypothetical protein